MCDGKTFGGFLVQKLCSQDKYFVRNQYEVKPHITVEEKNKFYHDTDVSINSSKTDILSISGSHNQGLMLNDAHFNMTHIMEQPIFFYLTQYHTFIYAILIFFLCCVTLALAAFLYYRRIKPLKNSSKPHNAAQDGPPAESLRAACCSPSPNRRNVLFFFEFTDVSP